MRISFVCGPSGPAGELVHALRLAEQLALRGHEVEARVLAAGPESLPRSPRVPVALVDPGAPGGGGASGWARQRVEVLVRSLESAPPTDVLHAEDTIAACAALRARGERDAPIVVRTVHHLDATREHELDELQREGAQGPDLCVAASRFWAERLEREYDVRAEIVRGGVDVPTFASCALDRADAGARMGWDARPTVLGVGGVDARKGSRTLLEAFTRARGRLGEGALLVLAGGHAPDLGYLRGFLDDADRLGLTVGRGAPAPEHDVALLRPLAPERVPDLYRAADAVALPSTREGFGLAALEAAAAGVPLVLSDLPVFAEIFTDGHDCLVIPVGHAGPLADALVRAVREEGLRARLVPAARETAERYTWTAAAQAHEDLYVRLAGD